MIRIGDNNAMALASLVTSFFFFGAKCVKTAELPKFWRYREKQKKKARMDMRHAHSHSHAHGRAHIKTHNVYR